MGRNYSVKTNKIGRMQKYTHSKHDFSDRRNLVTKPLIILSSVLSLALSVALFGIYWNEQKVLDTQVFEKTHRVLLALQAAHTQAMIHRGNKTDGNAVIAAINGTVENISALEQNMKLWLFMGPKVVAYQQKQGSNEVEPPLDEIDREVQNSQKTVKRFITETKFRHTMPVILGKGLANNPKCFTCHGQDMGLENGELIGGISASYDATLEVSDLYAFMRNVTVYMVSIIIFVATILYFLLTKYISRPINSMAEILEKISKGTEGVEVPDPAKTDSREIATLLYSAAIFNEHSKNQVEELRFALDEHAIVSIADVKGDITYANDKFCEISKYSHEELIGSNHNIIKSDEHSDEFWVDMWKVIANGSTWQGEIKNRNKLGGDYWVKTTIVPTLNEGGKPIQYVSIRTDVTADKQNKAALITANEDAERHVLELSDTQERLEKVASEQIALSEDLSIERDRAKAANIAKSEFLSTMSHEIRTPLNGVLGLAQLLKDTKLDEDQEAKVNTILSSGQSLLAIINDVLDMSKIEAGGLELEEKAFSLPVLISTITILFQSLADDKGIELAVSCDIVSEMVLKGDPVRLRQILWNLLSNAIKFTEQGRVHLTIEVAGDAIDMGKLIPSPKDHLLYFAVEDTGAGIAPHRVDAIFDAFTQEDSTITRKHGGTGLGLSIVKQLTELMGGTISADSELGIGTRFIAYIPFDAATDDEVEAISLRASNTANLKSEALNILIAEDNEINAAIVMAFLDKFGHSVKRVENGILAVDAAKEGWADLILMDIHMPEMNGIDATRAICATKIGKNTPIVGLTAEAFTDRHAQFIEAGMVDVLTKPFTEQQLADTLAANRLIDRPSESDDDVIDLEDRPVGGASEGATDVASETGASKDDDALVGDEEKLANFCNHLPAEVMSKLLMEAQSSLQNHLFELQQAVQDNNSQKIREAAHSIKGSSGSMFAMRLSEMAMEIEESSDDIEVIRELMGGFELAAADAIKWWDAQSDELYKGRNTDL